MTVQEFCKLFYEELEAGYWGDIEPDVFRNIAEGVEPGDHDNQWRDKLSEEEMDSSIEGMKAILERILHKA